MLYSILVHWEFVSRKQGYFVYFIFAPLGIWVKASNSLDILIEAFNTVGHRTAHRIQIENGTPYCKFSVLLNLRNIAVTCIHEPFTKFINGQTVTWLDHQRMLAKKFDRRQALHHGSSRDKHNALMQGR